MKIFLVYFPVFLLAACQGSVIACRYDSDCPQTENYCCGGFCSSIPCFGSFCYSDVDCPGPTIYCCIDAGSYCVEYESDCPLSAGAIIGIVFGVLVVVIGVATFVSCCMCISCPLHPSRRHRQGQIYNTRPTTYQTIANTTSTSFHPQPSSNPQQFYGQQYQTAHNTYTPPPQYTV